MSRKMASLRVSLFSTMRPQVWDVGARPLHTNTRVTFELCTSCTNSPGREAFRVKETRSRLQIWQARI